VLHSPLRSCGSLAALFLRRICGNLAALGIFFSFSLQATALPQQEGTDNIVEAKRFGDEEGAGRETDATREIVTETGSVPQTAQEIETGIVGGSPKMRSSTTTNPAAVPDYIHTLINLNKHGAIVSDIAEKLLNRGALKATGAIFFAAGVCRFFFNGHSFMG
jgi:hypothetical protein